jgi:hypothetical protein
LEIDLALSCQVQSALEVAVVGIVVIIIFLRVTNTKRPPNETPILHDNDILPLSPPSPPGYSAAPLGRLLARIHPCTSPSVVGRRRLSGGGGGGCRLSSSVVSSVAHRKAVSIFKLKPDSE